MQSVLKGFLEGLTGLRPNQGYQAYFDRDRQTVQIIPSGTDVPVKPIMSSSKKKLDMNSLREKLSHTYARVLMSTQS
ncbi:hypothetical protein CDAR_127021 [Caerostris darwini]|uniref:Uncharacterized protein n=1 Tax=Caerostris darwini TaxID=1538125 RepID=A0AAV4TBY3_9ARAC|nr:hypothetical protein CDAR_127021 [Caerostris darwini]